jgi:hypothetical protein
MNNTTIFEILLSIVLILLAALGVFVAFVAHRTREVKTVVGQQFDDFRGKHSADARKDSLTITFACRMPFTLHETPARLHVRVRQRDVPRLTTFEQANTVEEGLCDALHMVEDAPPAHRGLSWSWNLVRAEG